MATVPWPGTLKEGDRNLAVRALQSVLYRQGYTKIVRNGTFGANTKRALISWKKQLGLPRSAQTPTYGTTVHGRTAHLYTAQEIAWIKKYRAQRRAAIALSRAKAAAASSRVSTRQKKVLKMQAAGYLVIARRYNIHYTQGGMRMQGVKRRLYPPRYPNYEDCSSLATWLAFIAGFTDPNGFGYNGYGYTGSLAARGRRVPVSEARPGDMVFYGRGWPWSHVAIVISAAGWNATCVSHGSEIGPLHVQIDYRRIGQVRRYWD